MSESIQYKFAVLAILILSFVAFKSGQKMEQNKSLQITEDVENKIDSILANIALCEMSIYENDHQAATRYALRAKAHIIHIKNSIQYEQSGN